jgi:hypothetical protein
VVWRWQERFMHEGVEGLTRDKTRPSRIPPLPAETIDRVIALTNRAPSHEATHWAAPAMAKSVGISPSSVRRIWKGHGFQPHWERSFKLSTIPNSPRSSRRWSASISIRQHSRPEKLIKIGQSHRPQLRRHFPDGRSGGAMADISIDFDARRPVWGAPPAPV